jgi:hypothetical protein
MFRTFLSVGEYILATSFIALMCSLFIKLINILYILKKLQCLMYPYKFNCFQYIGLLLILL